MMVIFSVISSFCLMAAMAVSGIMSFKTTTKINDEKLSLTADFYSEKANTWLNNVASVLGPMALFMEEQVKAGPNADEIRAYNEDLTQMYDWANDVFSAQSTGEFYDGTGWIPEGDWGMSTREWYTRPQQENETIYCAAYLSGSTGQVISSVAAPFHVDGNVAGVVGMDFTLGDLYALIEEYSKDFDGYFMLVDGSENIIYHPNEKFNPTAEKTLKVNEVLDGIYQESANSGSSIKDYNGESVYVASSPIGDTGWTIYLMESSDVYMNNSLNQMIIALIIMVLAAIVMIIVTYFVSHSIVIPIISVKDAAVKMANGDFNIDINYNSNDEIGQLADSMKKLCENTNNIIDDLGHILYGMENGDLTTKSKDSSIYVGDYLKLITSIRNFRGKINATLSQINDVSSQVLVGAEQVSNTSQGVSQGTTEQASAIEELAATIHEVTNKVNDNARSADSAMNKTNEAGNEMQNANNKMNELIDAMSETKECSDQIGKIIKSIEDIAFQTNILALNAAVEAARAGTAGKGFAVVADEVRNLASKSAEAASNTNVLIENTIKSVDHGNKLVNEVAEVMHTVSDATKQVALLNTNICDSSSNIASSIEQINGGIEQVSGVIQTNAATAEQSAAASEELSGQAATLERLVKEFTLEK